MVIFNYLIKYSCKFLYFFMKLKKTNNNKVVFISRMLDRKSLDFRLIEEELMSENPNIKCVFLCKRITSFTKNFIGNIVYTFKCLSNLANAKVCVTDSFVPAISVCNHKKSLKILQIWHSMGAIKKFAYQTLGNESGRDKKTAEILCMHKKYDNIISGSKAMAKHFAKAFNYEEKKFLNYGLPRMDYLLKSEADNKKRIYESYPILRKKKNILYVPTFRTTNDDKTIDLINCFDYKKYNLIVKAHARQELELNDKVLTCSEFPSIDLISIADYIITDYSGIAIEAAILNKKTLYYVFDYEEYKKNNGLNIDLFKEMPGCVFKDAKELYKKIEKDDYDMKVLYKYKNKYIDVQDGTSTKKIVDLIIKWLGE